ncbi:hypothetical protein LBMAG33_5680 [Candidatus Levyibacteriota bacterium]|nr:hypothetical protein LBMAG33_5680 [Candidatus Levybacteria bacterium]
MITFIKMITVLELFLFNSSIKIAIASTPTPKTTTIPTITPEPVMTKFQIEQPIGSIAGTVTLVEIVTFIIQLMFFIGFVIGIAYIIYGGIMWIISGGDKAGVEAARNRIVSAIIGILIIAGAFLIISLVFQLLGLGNPLSGGFCIPNLANPCIISPR